MTMTATNQNRRPASSGNSNGKSLLSPSSPSTAIYSAFRNVSACNRCRIRKNRCDQRLPRCQSCEKADVHCVGYDPATKREIPRSYVYFLESRIAYLERLLSDNGIEFRPPIAYEGEDDELIQVSDMPRIIDVPRFSPGSGDVYMSGADGGSASGGMKAPGGVLGDNSEKFSFKTSPDSGRGVKEEGRQDPDERPASPRSMPVKRQGDDSSLDPRAKVSKRTHAEDASRRIEKLVTSVGMVPVHGTSDSRYLGSTSGISFARVVFNAVRSSVSSSVSERGSIRPGSRRQSAATLNGGAANAGVGSGGSMRDSFFGLQTKPVMKKAPLPNQELALKLTALYFDYANPQIPILHRVEFMDLIDRVYSTDDRDRSSRDLYLLNIVCAIGAGIIFDVKSDYTSPEQEAGGRRSISPPPMLKRRRLSSQQHQPEEYHASAVVHLDSCLNPASANDGFGGGLEELQAVLLLASFALLRPVAPGLWYIAGVAVRLAIDLGLHHEDGTGIDSVDEQEAARRMSRRESRDDPTSDDLRAMLRVNSRERGRREYVRDFRRRLWWCVYSFDRLVSACVGRPFGITDQVITTEFPSLLDDQYITKMGFVTPPTMNTPSYKHVAHHYFKLRLIQSEIQEVLQYEQAKLARKAGRKHRRNSTTYSNIPASPFLQRFDSFRSWRQDIHSRLDQWIDSAPQPEKLGVQFSIKFLELNYWQTLISLYRQSLTVPKTLASELRPTEGVESPSLTNVENPEDEDDIYLKVAEAGQKVLKLYRQLHLVRLVNYTYLATHHLFMAGISFLYAIWHSQTVRSKYTLDDVDSTVLAATSVLKDLMEKCPPAEACRDAFERMSKATVQMGVSTTGFGPQHSQPDSRRVSNTSQARQPSLSSEGMNDNNSLVPQSWQYQQQQQQQYQQTSPPKLGRLESIPEQPSESHISRQGVDNRTRIDFLSNPHDSQSTPSDYFTNNHHGQAHRDVSGSGSPRSPLMPLSMTMPRTQPPRSGYMNSQQQQQQQHTFYQPLYEDRSRHHQQQQHLSDPSPFFPASLDFLDHFMDNQPMYTTSSGGVTGADVNMTTMSMYNPPGGVFSNGANPTFDLGFGVGTVDFQHDWSENPGYDLFDGYFFGGT